ncbi:hypothetical protein D7Y13_07295 [Corallococcus praedator]|uniref:Glutamine amidotransferase type-2 domain-containing protein n=1 Tax=Corallococcus praedator TaxID=2316724 RepID=A0ABX9QPT0_9BACT|nr:MULTISPECIES: class II glutamine amidotransferase [Corallococcus]RKH19747.1 hypothetical protein D7X74_05955 [Corallococcus sp. CA047B]RKH32897.1 hypothetical protein D7X75_14090 [Corallococcus sp. CA031C]RKI13691.1 hypothetical protein D7Y13_07295 [Corallococcus praedator]
MLNLLALSFEGELAPGLDLRCLAPGRKPPDGWGVGYYPGGEFAATVLKEAAPQLHSTRSELVRTWDPLESSLMLLHLRTATWGPITEANTQPFCRSAWGRDWLLAHSGSLEQRLKMPVGARFEPVGSTDSETLFCRFLDWMQDQGWRSLGEVDAFRLRAWLEELNQLGPLTLVVSDGRDLLLYADCTGATQGWVWQVSPPYERLVLGDEDVELDLTRRGAKSRKGVIVATQPLDSRTDVPANWTQLTPGGLVLVRQGAIRVEALPPGAQGTVAPAMAAEFEARSRLRRPPETPVRVMDVVHRTVYRYQNPVERSSHLLRLTPLHDRLQSLLSHDVTLSAGVTRSEYEDVFGNRVRRAMVDMPYTELVMEARSRVELRDTDPLGYRPLHVRSVLPLVWMPWQANMLQPYLLPPELPDTQLEELSEYAMSFARRNDFDLLDTLLDINYSIFKEYQYAQGTTTLNTTAFSVYSARRGVCQDFANVFICLARLLGVPARYVCGYLYTGPKHANTAQAEASHAWVQVYLPEVGWKGFDPTNGILTQTDHVRVAVGRQYSDATPTTGTIYLGGGGEQLEVWVRCEPVMPEGQ